MLYKRKDSKYYWVKLKSQGRQVRQSTHQVSKRKAAVYESHLRDLLDRERLGNSGKTFEDAAIRWLEDNQHKRSIAGDATIIAWLRPYIGTLFLQEITRSKIEELRTLKCQEASRSTVNNYMALLRSILRAAWLDWEWIDRIPKVPMYPKEEKEIRWITPDEFETLAGELPEHLEVMARFAVSTGLRAAAIKALQWSWVFDDHLRLPPGIMKNKKHLTIPLSKEAICVLMKQKGQGFVFTYLEKPITGKLTTRAWKKAVKRAGLEPLRFHDLRHTWASWHVQNGTPIEVLKKLGGWRSLSMVLVYAHLAPSTLAQWADNAQEGSR